MKYLNNMHLAVDSDRSTNLLSGALTGTRPGFLLTSIPATWMQMVLGYGACRRSRAVCSPVLSSSAIQSAR